MCGAICDDNQFKVIKELKEYIIEATNIETSPDEMKVLDDICFRLWQLGLTLETKRKLKELQNDIKLNEAQIDDLTLEVANYKHALEEKNEIIMDLKEKNQELETTLLEYKAQENLYWNTATNNVNLREENQKLEKAIEIIKNNCVSNTNLWLVVCSRNYEDYKSFVENKDHELVRIEHNILTQQEYELLKEVFGNE